MNKWQISMILVFPHFYYQVQCIQIYITNNKPCQNSNGLFKYAHFTNFLPKWNLTQSTNIWQGATKFVSHMLIKLVANSVKFLVCFSFDIPHLTFLWNIHVSYFCPDLCNSNKIAEAKAISFGISLSGCLHVHMQTLQWRHNGCDSVSNHQQFSADFV